MSRLGPASRAVVMTVFGVLLVVGSLAPNVRAANADRSEVVLVLDFSASILQDAANRNRFAAAIERIADRVDATSSDLVAGDTTVTIVQFAARAADYQGCTEMKLFDSAPTVARFANCLRAVAGAYRKGLDPALSRAIGIDTNYVAAMERAATHLPPDAVRPALILLTDGKHDVRGVPVSQVQPAHDRLFGSRTPFALLPVGMGLESDQRDALEAGLVRLRLIRDFPACISGTVFEWPQVVFESAAEAGNAVAVALQNATCTFTVAPSPSPPPPPTPSPEPTPAAVQAIRLTAGDGRIELAWARPTVNPDAIIDYRARCRAGEGEWIESTEGVSLETKAAVEGLTNGMAYSCEIAAVSASSDDGWTAATATVTPIGRPAPPAKPSVVAQDRALEISVSPDGGAGVTRYRYECSGDMGGTWPAELDATSANSEITRIGNLTNGVDYVCRAFAANAIGMSDASPLSDAVRPCGSLIECNSVVLPILAVIGAGGVVGLLLVLLAGYRDRTRGYVIAVVDVVHTANLGHGSSLGIAFVRAPGSRRVTGIVADRGADADIRIRHLRGGRFAVKDRVGRHVTASGEPVVIVDSVGVRHELILRAFATNAAAAVSKGR